METKIIGALRRYHYMTVRELADYLHTSTAVINFALFALMNKSVVQETDLGYTLKG